MSKLESRPIIDPNEIVRPSDEALVAARQTIEAITGEVLKSIVIPQEDLSAIVGTLAVGGHVLIDGDPGTGKTELSKALAFATGGTHARAQGTPDLMPGDILGSRIWNEERRVFDTHKGAIFANITQVDEINRMQPKTQSALLEAMSEGTVTLPGDITRELANPHIVLATHNPNEIGQGTYPLTKANTDRFLSGVRMGQDYMAEIAVLAMSMNPHKTAQVVQPQDLVAARQAIRGIVVGTEMQQSIVDLTAAVRVHEHVDAETTQLSGARKNINILALARVAALNAGRKVVKPEDIDYAARYVLPHRIGVTEDAQENGVTAHDIVASVL